MTINNNILSYLSGYSTDILKINRLVVSTFCGINSIQIKKNKKIKDLIISKNDTEEYQAFLQLKEEFKKTNQPFSFEELIELFEFVISPSDKLVNGAVYTPKNIRDFIVSNSIKADSDILNSTACDISCGCGGFLYEYALKLNQKGKCYKDIIEQNLYGIDIMGYSIDRSKILLSLLAISNGEDISEFKFNFFIGDSLEFDWYTNSKTIELNKGFDYIFGNPPYVGSSNLDTKTKDLMKNWSVSLTGKLDLYIPFFQIGLNWLKEGGTLGYITVNNFYRSLNGRALRKYFSENEFQFNFIDFGSDQVFKGRLTYTCICEITKKKGHINYINTLSNNINNLRDEDYVNIEYKNIDDFNGWILDEYKIQININKLENSGEKLIDLFEIRNGFATLRNKIYLFTPVGEDENFYFMEKNSKRYRIEKDICRDAIKPNILKSEEDIINYNEKLIFPYQIIIDNLLFAGNSNVVNIIPENDFRNNYPNTYNYLLSFKNELKKRDKGKRDYETWYAYGRSQALNIIGQKLFFPYISDKPYFIYSNNENLLFYNGYAIISNSEEELKFIQKIMTSQVFWYYIKNSSKPYANNYFALAKNYVKNFSIPNFSAEEKRRFMNLKSEKSITKFLEKKYNISISDKHHIKHDIEDTLVVAE